MGSSCFSRGNDQVLTIINEYLEENNLLDKVDFRGHLCQGNCQHGPNLTIGEAKYNEVSRSNIRFILQDALQALTV